jgi:curli biogenesis system outer membrane secretion channel CsgG
MKKIVCSLLIISSLLSCKKEDAAPVEKTYTVKYQVVGTPQPNSNISGSVSYISKNSSTATGSWSISGWTVTESNWALKPGDKVGFTATLSNLASYQAAIIVDGAIRVFNVESSTLPLNYPITLSYTIE